MVQNTIKNSGLSQAYTPREAEANTTISIRVSKQERDALLKIAVKNERSLSNQARLFLLESIKSQKDNVKITSDL